MDDLACLSPPERVRRWAQLLEQVDSRIRERAGGRVDWVRLKLNLIRKGRAMEVYSAAEAAVRTAGFVAELHRGGMAEEVAEVLPSAEELVRACLAEIPIPPERALTRGVLDDLDVTAIRNSRQARILVDAAEQHAARLRDPRIAAQLRRWTALKPRLV
ncbi:hypothetical protein NLX83_32025 [Allokutzneria sp. A3M-2-11 16]|uniref:hypothetical protein n=1 Tax=Allokutzneria sp. A3M-2-11 16 TaxID=2962043 RepID=UPI0020B7B821|nr:hypothetical protein [Allokutzneria sp. A3M-2-11 16]MCP3803906.1 hypothetical protein [Allokutzneria sp. A3M-2-11 16]